MVICGTLAAPAKVCYAAIDLAAEVFPDLPGGKDPRWFALKQASPYPSYNDIDVVNFSPAALSYDRYKLRNNQRLFLRGQRSGGEV